MSKNLRKKDIPFLSNFNKCLKDNTWEQIRYVVEYVKENGLSIRKVCEFLDWKVGDKKDVINGTAQLVLIRKRNNNFLTFEVTCEYSYTPEDFSKYAKHYEWSKFRRLLLGD